MSARRTRMPRFPADLSLSAVIVLAVVPVLLVSGALTRNAIDATTAYRQHVARAALLADRLLGDQIDEETGVRGYTSTRDRVFLQPYADAQRDYETTYVAARQNVVAAGADPAPLDREHALHERWRTTIAEPLLRTPRGARATVLQLAGKSIVDEERRADLATQAELQRAYDVSSERFSAAVRSVTDETVGACVAVALLAVVLGYVRRRAMRRIAAERERYEREKRIADALQDAVLQTSLPLSPNVGLHAAYVPAEDSARVGGDWYDAFELADGRLLFSIGDVAGHGLTAAIAMSRARQAILVAALHENDPSVVLQRANSAIVLQDGPMVSAICGYVDARTTEVVYATAGHPAPIMARRGVPAHLMPADGIVLGVEPDAVYRTFVAHANEGGLLVLYTDGVIEHDRDVIAGEQALLRAVDGAIDAPNPALAIQSEIFRTSRPRDDVAILTLSFGALGTPERRTRVAAAHAGGVDLPAMPLRASEVDGDGVSAAEDHADPLARTR